MKKIRILLCCLLIVLIVLTGCSFHLEINTPYTEIVQKNWSLKLPETYKEIYSTDSGASIQGDGQRYHVFQYNDAEDISNSLKWEEDKDKVIQSAVASILKSLSVADENMPDFQNSYKCYTQTKKGSSQLYLIFAPDTKKLYIIESFL